MLFNKMPKVWTGKEKSVKIFELLSHFENN